MTRTRIGVISPHAGFSQLAGELAVEMGIDLVIKEYSRTGMGDVLKEWENNHAVEAVVTSEIIAVPLRENTNLPVITVQVSGFDLLAALSKARSVGKRIIIAEYDHLSTMPDVNELDVPFVLYKQKDQLVDMLLNMRHEVDAVVGTMVTVLESAREAGLPAFLVQTNRGFIRCALEKAVRICLISRRDKKLCRSLQAVLNNAYDGIIAVDERGKVVIFNPVAEKITGLTGNQVLERHITAITQENLVCRMLYSNGGSIAGDIVQLGGLPFLLNRVPVSLGPNMAGLVITFQAADKIRQMESKIRKELHRQGLLAKYRFSDLVGRSAMMEETIKEARKYARSNAAVLITGESGTGKELFAHSMHNESARRGGPFVAVNCAALPESLLESELFGYEEGAFTGAKKGGKQGLFALAHGGTIFLDEIGDLGLSLQARLLRVLQQKELLPVGGQRVVPVDVRVISATNRNLPEELEEGAFRVDLYYRLNVLHLHIPPLRMRMEDVPLLFKHFFQRLTGLDYIKEWQINDWLLDKLKEHLWPGNVRELEGFVERYAALGEEDVVNHTTFRHLLAKLWRNEPTDRLSAGSQVLMLKLGHMEEMERQIIEQAISMVNGGKTELARVLGLSRTTLWKKLKKIDKTGG